tara:strand:+ start:893 stop:1927 length:1035 start_codon:yes stop_codon:yes gene_type:complete
MELYEREFFIAKIFMGYVKYKVKDDLYIYMHPPTVNEYIESQEVFMDAYHNAIDEGVMSPEECLSFMIENGIWNGIKEEKLKDVEEEIEKFKLHVYENFFNTERKEQARKKLKQAKHLLSLLNNDKHSYDHITTTGVATYAKNAWIVENCTKLKNGERYKWEEVDVQTAMGVNNQSIIPEATVRELSRTNPWRGYWGLRNQEGNIFNKHPLELTFNQQHIISWSKAYENVYESPECPTEDIINDDDAFDGWMIKQRKEREASRGQKIGESLTDKHQGANEIFVFAPTEEDAERVNNLNNPAAKMQKRARTEQIYSSEEGGVHYQQFRDVKMNLAEQLHDMQKNK